MFDAATFIIQKAQAEAWEAGREAAAKECLGYIDEFEYSWNDGCMQCNDDILELANPYKKGE